MAGLTLRCCVACLVVHLVIVAGCGWAPDGDDFDGSATVTVFAAASLSDAMTDLAAAFERETGTTVESSFGPSSGLREQILAGAPADVFASARPADLETLLEAGEATDGRVLTTNAMQIAVPAGNPGEVDGLDDLARPELLVGLCAPEVPCGAYGREALAQVGVQPSIDTEATDARSLLTHLASGDLDAGLVYATDVLAAEGAVDGVDLPPGVDVEIDYVAGRITRSAVPDAAEAFIDFARSPEGRDIFRTHGFGAS